MAWLGVGVADLGKEEPGYKLLDLKRVDKDVPTPLPRPCLTPRPVPSIVRRCLTRSSMWDTWRSFAAWS